MLQIKTTRFYVFFALVYIVISYSVYFLFDREVICQLGREDNFFEYLTAICFLASSLFFLLCYFSGKNSFFLLLSIVMLIGSGEEVSWGQRMFGYSTPDFMREINVQREFTLHNIEFFNGKGSEHNIKIGFKRLISINFLYKLFWLLYCVLLPVASILFSSVFEFLRRIKLPVPPLTIGIFFLINWLIFRITLSFILPSGESMQYYDTIAEIRECSSALLFMTTSFYFFKTRELNINQRSRWG